LLIIEVAVPEVTDSIVEQVNKMAGLFSRTAAVKPGVFIVTLPVKIFKLLLIIFKLVIAMQKLLKLYTIQKQIIEGS
jgi:hypothetical protein